MLLFSPSMKLSPSHISLRWPVSKISLWQIPWGGQGQASRSGPDGTGRLYGWWKLEEKKSFNHLSPKPLHQGRQVCVMCWKLKAQKTNKQSLPVVINASGGDQFCKAKKKKKENMTSVSYFTVNVFMESKSAGDGSLAALTASGRCQWLVNTTIYKPRRNPWAGLTEISQTWKWRTCLAQHLQSSFA